MINQKNIKILNDELNINLNLETIDKLNLWQKIFLEYNSHTNLMSKNDIEVLFQKHVFDSLAIVKWDEFLNYKNILDVGCGGGFPCVILAICFPQLNIIANDSRIKKINFIKAAKEKLNLKNLDILYSRIEEAPCQNVDLIVSRAVGKIVDVFELSKKHYKKEANFVIYKAKTAQEETEDFLKKYNNTSVEIIPYNLPLKENFERNLVIIKK